MEDIVLRSRVLLVDDESLVRAGLRMILEGSASLEVVGEAANGHEAIAAVRKVSPDVVLMDIRMPVMDGLAATEHLLAEHPELKIIVLTTFDTDAFVLSALRRGASGFLLKDTRPAELVDAVVQVASGRIMLSPSVTKQLVAAVGTPADTERRAAAARKLERLTPRENEMAAAIAQGLSNAEIAENFYLSVSTVKTHIARILDKLAVDNRVQIAICVHTAKS
ncbi:response regulator transcription factor [Salinibacterium sp. M195]|uniref:response regulator n=1 Tax=Salinibacterium sp. M195 TaxID=2583374 RepID=UPI0021048465|nr:response regulator transcription factor [Salinibacterium sp. M195]QYH36259.1 response regulator transcription factor [Salinibacterium sp. M195]